MKKSSLAPFLALLSLLAAACATPAIEVRDLDFASIRDGSYEGSYKGSMGAASVRIVIAAGRASSASLTSFNSSPVGAPAKAIVGRVLERQSLAVDSVSGATYSSRVILRAFQDALEKGR